MTNQELWKTIKALRARIIGLERENRELKEQIKRYRKALEEIRDMGIYGEIISTDEANLAEKALEGEK